MPVECVIADTTIRGVVEAAKCADRFVQEGIGLSMNVTPCWCYGMGTKDMNPLLPKKLSGDLTELKDREQCISLLLLPVMTR